MLAGNLHSGLSYLITTVKNPSFREEPMPILKIASALIPTLFEITRAVTVRNSKKSS
jgi:hypothetical protein